MVVEVHHQTHQQMLAQVVLVVVGQATLATEADRLALEPLVRQDKATMVHRQYHKAAVVAEVREQLGLVLTEELVFYLQ